MRQLRIKRRQCDTRLPSSRTAQLRAHKDMRLYVSERRDGLRATDQRKTGNKRAVASLDPIYLYRLSMRRGRPTVTSSMASSHCELRNGLACRARSYRCGALQALFADQETTVTGYVRSRRHLFNFDRRLRIPIATCQSAEDEKPHSKCVCQTDESHARLLTPVLCLRRAMIIGPIENRPPSAFSVRSLI